mmetsp:Transcript_12231/g.23360  ORF Transcript_12231/g.23360 Transcript_12231/m.23360 type:complete len:229 (-) Transcript_12231:21-707(-)
MARPRARSASVSGVASGPLPSRQTSSCCATASRLASFSSGVKTISSAGTCACSLLKLEFSNTSASGSWSSGIQSSAPATLGSSSASIVAISESPPLASFSLIDLPFFLLAAAEFRSASALSLLPLAASSSASASSSTGASTSAVSSVSAPAGAATGASGSSEGSSRSSRSICCSFAALAACSSVAWPRVCMPPVPPSPSPLPPPSWSAPSFTNSYSSASPSSPSSPLA